jgi:hypothetical protein
MDDPSTRLLSLGQQHQYDAEAELIDRPSHLQQTSQTSQALYYPRQRHDTTWIPWIKNNAKDRRKMP